VQLGALALAAARVPLTAAHFVAPAESLALDEMLVTQFATSAMLIPFLLRDARSTLGAMLTAAPMLQLAAVLSTTPPARVAGAWTCLACWLAGAALWGGAVPSRHRGVMIAIANLLTLGGLILWYLAAEFGSDLRLLRAFPLVATLRFAHGVSGLALPLSSTAVLMSCGAIARALLPRCCARRGT
jgi:hypothetical protein